MRGGLFKPGREMGETSGNASGEEDFLAECSDEENYNPTGAEKGLWEPDPKDIKLIYERLSRGEIPELEWKCHGRRSPTPERREENMETGADKEEDTKVEEKVAPTEFDFDDSTTDANPMTPRRTPGSTKVPRSTQKRVARLDKIMDDIIRHKKIEESTKSKERSSPRSGSPIAAMGDGTPLRPPNTQKGRMSPKKLS